MNDLISRQAAIDELTRTPHDNGDGTLTVGVLSKSSITDILNDLPSAQPTLYGYNIEHLELIARVLQKEDLPPERVVEMLTDLQILAELLLLSEMSLKRH